MTDDDRVLSDLLHAYGDGWSPQADPAALAHAFNDQLAGARRGRPAGARSAVRPLSSGRLIRIGLTVCALAAAVAVPLAVRSASHVAGPAVTSGPLRLEALPLPAGFVTSGPGLAMTCAAPDFCMIVGALDRSGHDVPADLELVGGSLGSPQALPTAATHGAQIATVGCSSATSCVAVSALVTTGGADHVYFATFDGTTWRALAAPPGIGPLLQATRRGAGFSAQLSCPAGGACMLVATTTEDVGPVVSASLDGSVWSRLPAFPGDPQRDGYLIHSLACSSTDSCYAVGSLFVRSATSKQCSLVTGTGRSPAVDCSASRIAPVIVRWDGTSWRTIAVRSGPPGLFVPGAGCVAGGDCYALEGSIGDATQTVLQLQGGRSTVVDEPAWPPQLAAIACPAAGSCLVSGETGYHDGKAQHYVLLQNGRWTTETVDLPASEYLAVLGDLACPAAGTCYQLYSTDTYHPWAPGTSYVLALRG